MRIEPDAHRVLALTEDDDLRDALDAREVVDDVELRVVAHDQACRDLLVSDVSAMPMTKAPEFLATVMPSLLHRRGKQSERGLHRVLHVGRGDVEVDAQIEGAGDRRDALRAGRADVAQPLNRIDGLLERRRDLRLDRLRARADVDCGDRYDRRRDLRILRDRHVGNDDEPGDQDDQRADHRENGPGEEDLRHVSCTNLRGYRGCAGLAGSRRPARRDRSCARAGSRRPDESLSLCASAPSRSNCCGRDELDDRQMLLARLQVLPHREDVDAGRARVVHRRFDLGLRFAQAPASARSWCSAAVRALGVRENRAAIDRSSRACRARTA